MNIYPHRYLTYLLIFSFVSTGFGHNSAGTERPKIKPGWFWNQPADCGMVAVGMDRHSTIYPENAEKRAHEKSIQTYLRQIRTEFSGGQAFSITERGAVWMGDDIREDYDTSRFEILLDELPVLDTAVAGTMILVLTGSENCSDEVENNRSPVSVTDRPHWVNQTPSEPGYLFAVGTSEGYFYPMSSWENAENAARRNLAASIHSRVQGLHGQETGVSMEIIYSDLSVTLSNAVIISRYHDTATNLYYVLVRMPLR